MADELEIAWVAPRAFAPRVEKVKMEISVREVRHHSDLFIQVKDVDGRVVYIGRLRESPKSQTVEWDGRGDHENPRKPGRYVTPNGSPYRIQLFGTSKKARHDTAYLGVAKKSQGVTTLVDTAKRVITTYEVKVRYHSLELELMTWDEAWRAITKQGNTDYPGPGALQIPWLKYRLNQLGFPAGPIDADDTPEFRAAVRRYRQSHKTLYVRPWQVSPEGEIVIPRNDQTGYEGLDQADQPLIDELKKSAGKREIHDPPDAKVFTRAGEGLTSKVFVDIGRYYTRMEELLPAEPFSADRSSKHRIESDWLTRPALPLKATLYVENSKGEKVKAQAAGDLSIRWNWTDSLEETDTNYDLGGARDDGGKPLPLPAPEPARPSRTTIYVKGALAAASARIPSTWKNARVPVGGLVSGDDTKDRNVVFQEFDPAGLYPFDPLEKADSGFARTRIREDRDDRPELLGASCVWFRPSLIGGDNYRIEASLVIPADPDAKRRKAVVEEYGGKLSAKTGKIVVWRRDRIAAHVLWPALSGPDWDAIWNRLHGDGGGVNWDKLWKEVRAEFAHAFVHLEGPLVSNPVDQCHQDFAAAFQKVLTDAKRRAGSSTYWTSVVPANHAFNAAAYYPNPATPRKETETTAEEVVRRVGRILAPELAAWGAGQPAADNDFRKCPRLKALKTLVGKWSTQDEALPAATCPGDAILSPMEKDAILVWASEHYSREIKRVTRDINEKDRYRKFRERTYKDPATAPAPYRLPANPWGPLAPLGKKPVSAQEADDLAQKADRLIASCNQRIRSLVDPEIAAWAPSAPPPAAPRLTAASNLVELWGIGVDDRVTESGIADDDNTATTANYLQGLIKKIGLHYKTAIGNIGVDGPGTETLAGEGLTWKTPLEAMQPFQLLPEHRAELKRRALTSLNELMSNFIKVTQVPILEEIEEFIYRNHGPGIIILDFLPHQPVDLSAYGLSARYVSKAFASANGHGLVIIDQAHLDAYKWPHLFAHEVAHTMFLRHWKNSSGQDPSDHDHADENCQMSYAYEPGFESGVIGNAPHYAIGNYAPHFCGKCNLKLRGWNLRGKMGPPVSGVGVDVLPQTSDPTTPLLIAWTPNVTHRKVEPPNLPFIPSPRIIEEEALAMAREMLEDPAFVLPNPHSRKGRLMLVGNPVVDESSGPRTTIVWSGLPAKTLPEGEVWPPSDNYKVTYPKDFDQAWCESLNTWATLGGMNVTLDTGDPGIALTHDWHHCHITDSFHEACHFIGNWAPPSRILDETITDIMGWILTSRFKWRLPGGWSDTQPNRLEFQYNPSYAEVVLAGIDQWLPRMGFKNMATYYCLKGNDGLLDAIFDPDQRAQYVEKLTRVGNGVACRDLYVRKDPGMTGPNGFIRMPGGAFRVDIQRAIDAVSSPQLKGDLADAIEGFLDFLERQVGTFHRDLVALLPPRPGDGSVTVERAYALAGMTRRTQNQFCWMRALKQTEEWEAAATRLRVVLPGLADYKVFLNGKLAALNQNPAINLDEAYALCPPRNQSYW